MRPTATGCEVEEVLALLGVLENACLSTLDRRLEGAFREAWRVAVTHHQRFWMQLLIGDAVLAIIRPLPRRSPLRVSGRCPVSGSNLFAKLQIWRSQPGIAIGVYSHSKLRLVAEDPRVLKGGQK